jgi:hypothetical protein
MSTRTLLCVIVCVALLGALTGRAADKPADTSSDAITFRAVDSKDGPMIQIRANKATFLVPYIIVPPGGSWPETMQGEMRQIGGTVRWAHGKDVIRAKTIAISSSDPSRYIDWVN